METHIEESGDHVVAHLKGDWDPTEMVEAMQNLKARATQLSCQQVVKNCLELSAPKTEFHRFEVGVAMADLFPPPFRVLVLLPQPLINKFTENTARNRGGDVLVCSDKEEGLLWLREESRSD